MSQWKAVIAANNSGSDLMAQEMLDSFPSQIRFRVEWGDMDALQHVNNIVPIRWYESSRIDYMEQFGIARQLQQLQLGPILAAVNCSYKRQLFYPDNVVVGCRASKLGKSSITLHHVVFSERLGEIAAEGESVVVVFDFDQQKPVRVPEEIRELITSCQPHMP